MSDGSSWKPNWRDVWIWAAVMSAALSALLTFAVFVQERPGSSFNRWEVYLAVWATFFTMLTLTGVIMVFRMTYSPEEFAERHSGGEAGSKKSVIARATDRTLRFIARL